VPCELPGDPAQESTTVTARGQGISTQYFRSKILKEEIHTESRLRKQIKDIFDHLTSGCLNFENLVVSNSSWKKSYFFVGQILTIPSFTVFEGSNRGLAGKL
jgi:hypothetical protein